MFWCRSRKWELALGNGGKSVRVCVRVCAQMDGPGAANAPMIHYSPFISQCWMGFSNLHSLTNRCWVTETKGVKGATLRPSLTFADLFFRPSERRLGRPIILTRSRMTYLFTPASVLSPWRFFSCILLSALSSA